MTEAQEIILTLFFHWKNDWWYKDKDKMIQMARDFLISRKLINDKDVIIAKGVY